MKKLMLFFFAVVLNKYGSAKCGGFGFSGRN